MKTRLFFFILILTVSCKRSNEKIHPTVETILESVYASGIVKSKNQYQVYSTVNGLIQEILVSEGDTVKKGDPLMKVLNESLSLLVHEFCKVRIIQGSCNNFLVKL